MARAADVVKEADGSGNNVMAVLAAVFTTGTLMGCACRAATKQEMTKKSSTTTHIQTEKEMQARLEAQIKQEMKKAVVSALEGRIEKCALGRKETECKHPYLKKTAGSNQFRHRFRCMSCEMVISVGTGAASGKEK